MNYNLYSIRGKSSPRSQVLTRYARSGLVRYPFCPLKCAERSNQWLPFFIYYFLIFLVFNQFFWPKFVQIAEIRAVEETNMGANRVFDEIFVEI